MKVIRNNIIPVKPYTAINLFGLLFARKDAYLTAYVINHEQIHTAQMKELGYVLFYLLYILEWLVRLPMKGKAYYNISFEREAYDNQLNLDYLSKRRRFAQWRKQKTN